MFESLTLNGNIEATGTMHMNLANVEVNGVANLYPGGGLFLGAPGGTSPAQALDFNINFIGGAGSQAIVSSEDLTIAAGVTVQGGRGTFQRRFGGGGGLLTNEGLISANRPDEVISILTSFVNHGVAEAINGGMLHVGGQWQNSGTIRAIDSTLALAGFASTANLGTLDLANSEIRLNGYLENTGRTFDFAAGNQWVAELGTLKGGTFNIAPGSPLRIGTGGATLDSVVFNGDINVPGENSALRVLHGLNHTGQINLSGPGSRVLFQYSGAYNNGTVFFDPTTPGEDRQILGTGSNTITFGPQAVVRGGRGLIVTGGSNTIVNQGRISADVADTLITIYAFRFQNEGVVEAINGGQLVIIPPSPLGPVPMEFVNSGTLNPGLTNLDILGDFIQTETGELRFSLGEEGCGSLSVSGSTSVAGTLTLALHGGLAPVMGTSYQVLQFDPSHLSGSFSSIVTPPLPTGWSWDLSGLYTDGRVTVIPGPAALSLLGVALVAAGFRRSRRAGAQP